MLARAFIYLLKQSQSISNEFALHLSKGRKKIQSNLYGDVARNIKNKTEKLWNLQKGERKENEIYTYKKNEALLLSCHCFWSVMLHSLSIKVQTTSTMRKDIVTPFASQMHFKKITATQWIRKDLSKIELNRLAVGCELYAGTRAHFYYTH